MLWENPTTVSWLGESDIILCHLVRPYGTQTNHFYPWTKLWMHSHFPPIRKWVYLHTSGFPLKASKFENRSKLARPFSIISPYFEEENGSDEFGFSQRLLLDNSTTA